VRVLLVSLLTVFAMAQQTPSDQDPMHKTVLKNSNLLVLHVVLQPGQSTGWHTHSRDSIAVQLSGAEITMQPEGKDPGPRRSVRPGDVAASDYTAHPFTHKVNNVGTTNFDVLDIEALTRQEGKESDPIAPVAAENPSMRVYRWELGPGESSAEHSHRRPYLIVAATPMALKMTAPDGRSSEHPVQPGDLHWIDQKVTHTLTNNGKESGVLVEIELK